MDIIDRNILASFALLKSDPGINKSRLYATKHGMDVVDFMIAQGYVVQEDRGRCYLTDEGTDVCEALEDMANAFGQREDVDRLVETIVARYNKRLVPRSDDEPE